MMDFINDPKWGFDEEEKKWAQDSYNILVKQIGEFVNIDSVDVNITKLDTVFSYPRISLESQCPVSESIPCSRGSAGRSRRPAPARFPSHTPTSRSGG